MNNIKDVERMLYTTEDVAARLSIGVTKTKELIRSGDLRSIKIGSRRRILAFSLTEYIAHLDIEQNGAPRE